MKNKNTKVMRVPPEFDNWLYNISVELTRQTGVQHKKSDTMRKLSKSRITTNRGKIDWRLL